MKSSVSKAIAVWGSWLLVCLHVCATPGLLSLLQHAGGLLPIDGAQAITQGFDGPQSVISTGPVVFLLQPCGSGSAQSVPGDG
jgi:hypothetical protein